MPATYVKVAEVMKSYPSLTQPYLVVGDDGKLYILKHAKSQQDLLTMAAEYIATKFGVMSNVPVLDCTIIEVDEVALELFNDCAERNGATVPDEGLYFASIHKDGISASAFDSNFLFSPRSVVLNSDDATFTISYDTLIQNFDTANRNILISFTDSKNQNEYEVNLIDQGCAFLGLTWPALNIPYPWNIFGERAYVFKAPIRDMISKIPEVKLKFQNFTRADFKQIIDSIPATWGISAADITRIENFIFERIEVFDSIIEGHLTAKEAS